MPAKSMTGVANFGLRPTLGETPAPRLEVHLFDFNGMLYGLKLTVAFAARIRPERRFDSLGALTAQIAEDCAHAKSILSTAS
ncbi:MAG: riboflavin kinase [Alphaproteobacteria bacterium]